MNKEFSGETRADELGAQSAVQEMAQTEAQRAESMRPELVSQQAVSSQVRKFKLTIAGESYFLVSDEPEERVRAVARLVDGQMRAITQAGHSDDPKRVAVLVALQCASKMLAHTELIEKCQAYNDKLLGLIADEMTKFYASNEQAL